MANIIPIVLVGAAAYYFGRRKRRKKKNGKALPPSESRGTVFPAGEVDVIEAGVGERFTISIPENPGTGYSWSLEASPPEETIKLVGEEREAVDNTMGGTSNHLFIFETKKPGSGSLVFHYLRPFEKGKVPPEKVLEIQTKVS